MPTPHPAPATQTPTQPPADHPTLQPLRGEATVDPRLLDEAVAEINRLHHTGGLELARAIGSYVVRAFFDDSLDTFNAASREHHTFRALAQRPGERELRQLPGRLNPVGCGMLAAAQLAA